MLYPEFKYIGFKSDLRTKSHLIELPLPDTSPQKEFYASIYRFNQKILQYSSLADLGSDVVGYCDHLVFDFDSHSDLEHAYTDTVELSKALGNLNAFHEVYFSGNKGFHLLVPTCQFGFVPTNDEGVLRRMAEILAGRFKTFDSTIYNKTRIFRLPETWNSKGGLYKIAVPNLAEIGCSDVLAMAKEPSTHEYPAPYAHVKVDALCRLYERCKTKVIRAIQASEPKESFGDWGLIKSASEGNRNATLYGMARDLARHGIFERDALKICQWWNKDLRPALSEEEVATTVKSAYKKGINELVVSDNVFNFAINSKKALAQLRNAYANFSENVVNTGYKFLDEYTMGFFKGELTFIISRPGNFKTCLLSNILHGISQNTNKPCLFFSMEMDVEPLTARHVQKAEGLTQFEVIQAIKDGISFDRYEEEFKNVHIVKLSSLNTDRILTLLDDFMEQYGPLGALGFDYLSLFEGCANDTAKTARMATELKTRVAKAANCPTFCLVQAKRDYQGNEGDLEIDLTSGKDSSSIEDSGDYVIGTWGHWEEGQKNLYGRFLKARKFHSAKYQNGLPYFRIKLDKERMDVKNFEHVISPPKFRQRENVYD